MSLVDLARFIEAQNPVLEQVQRELKAGEKRTHWMWYVFPQISGLGMSAMSQHYAISGVEEARAYMAHPVLGKRLVAAVRLVLDVPGRSAAQIFGPVDAAKFCSCVTLFGAVSDEAVFGEALARYFDEVGDAATLRRL